MVSQLFNLCGSAHDKFSFSFICFLPFAGSVTLYAIKHQMKVGRLSPVVMLPELNHCPTRYGKAFALFIVSVRRFPMPHGYGLIPILMGESAGLTRSI
jgi:hypothetical protein